MAAMVGVIGAEIVTMGVVALPAMLARGYKKELALGCICAGGGLATLIPPSVVFIMYGLTAGVSIGQLYMAGVIPGLMLAGAVHRLHHRPLQAAAGVRAAARSAEDLAMPLREKLALLQGADPAGPGRVQRARLALPRLGDADRGGRRRRRRRGARRGLEPASSPGPACAAPSSDTTKVTAMLYWLFFGSSALIGVYTLAGGTKLIQDAMTGLPVGPIGVVILIQIDLDHPRLLHRLDRHPAADRADLRAGRRRRSASTRSGSACCSA